MHVYWIKERHGLLTTQHSEYARHDEVMAW